MSASGAAVSIEDILSKAQWVNSIIDPSLCADQLNEIFQEVIFSFPAEDDLGPAEEETGPRLRTARQRKRDERRRREMQEGLIELQDQTAVDDESIDEEDLDEEESDLQEEINLADQDFLDWIELEQPPERSAEEVVPPSRRDIELELTRVGLGAEQQAVADNELPERFVEITKKEGRSLFGPKMLPGGYTYKLPLEREAYWILGQLRNAGQPLAHNTRICALACYPFAEVVDDAVLVAITYALKKMTQEFLEPAHLMLYHQTHLHPLLFALFEDSNMQKAGEHIIPMTSYAYSTKTGSRQKPYLNENDVGFDTLAKRPIGTRDPSWRGIREADDFTQRKPGFIELGRLLVRILELDVLCHQLEFRRQQMLLMLEGSTEARVQNQRAILENTVFESAVDVDIWQSFVQSLMGSNQSRGRPFRRIQELGLGDAFEEYSLTELQYQENLLQNTPQALCPSHQIRLLEWADQVGKSLAKPMSAEFVLSLFNGAIVDQFSKLPVLCKQIMDLFCTVGHLIVTHNWVKRQDDIYPISAFLVDHQRHYLELLELKSQGKVDLHYVLDESYIRHVLRENELYHTPPVAVGVAGDIEEEWYAQRQSAFNGLVNELMKSLVPRVKAELRLQARYHTTKDSVERLGTYCSQGPYQPTKLALSGFSDDVLLWEPEWNVVEALPLTEPNGSRLQHRVCGVYRSDNGVTIFVFIDEMGRIIRKTRWAELNMSTDTGRTAALNDQIQLEKLFEECFPSVVAVAATAPDSLDVMQRVQRFLRDRIYANSRVRIPVVWAPSDVARFFSESRFAASEMPTTDTALRMGVGLARFVQDPLNVIATLFDSKKTALQLFSSSFQYSRRDQQEALYAALCWEMSLWVAATGFWIDDCILRPNSLALLQFVPGLGISKATVLHKAINEDRPSDRASLKRLVEEVLSCAVAANATSIIRIPPLSRMGEMMETKWHPLDQTLIPLEEYDVAAYVAAAASRNDKLKHKAFLALNLIEFVTQASEYRRRSVHHEIRDARGVLDAIREKKIPGYTLISGAREVDFISDELVANGLSFMRRPYRRMTTKGLLFHVAGVAFFTKDEVSAKVPSHSHRTDDLVIHEDTYLCGIIEGFRAGRSPGIRITTSRGLRAFMHVNDIDDENVKQEVLERIRHLEASREGGEDSVSLQPYVAPEWLQRGSVIQGTVIRCNWPRCEFLLRWCAPKTVEMREVAEQHFTSYADVIRDGASSANSIRTAQMEADASVFCTKISEHPLFRDVSNVEAMALLRDKDIGEVLFRPSSHGKSKAICMVKIGEAVTCSMVIAEDRRSDGRIYYRFKDTISRETGEFNDVDEFHQKYIIPMVALVQNLRSHRRFVGSIQDIKSSLIAQQQGTQRFAYAFFENTKRNRPPLYRVATRGGGKDHYFPLHISDKFIFVQLPFVSSSSQGRVSNIWVSCINAERVSEVVKQHAARSV